MEKLNREERGKIASVLIQSISKLCNVPCGASYDDIGYEEATAKKAHSVLCAILAYKLGFLDERKEKLVDVDLELAVYSALADRTGELPADFNEEALSFYSDVGEKSMDFLYEVLKHSSWEIEELGDFYDIDDLTDEEITWYMDMIPKLFAYIKESEYRYPSNEELKELTDRLEKLGVETEYYFEMDECKLLSLRNPKIKKAVTLCKQNAAIRSLPEYEEIGSYLKTILFIRRYEYENIIKDDGDMFFVLGTCYSDHEERSEMYHLIWETVFLLIFAEWAAEEILEYSGEKGADQDG